MLGRRTTGSVVCPSCGSLVGVRDDKCYTCGRANPGLWGFGPLLRRIGTDLGFAQLVIGACVTIWVLMLLMSGGELRGGSLLSALSPSPKIMFLFGESGAVPVFGLIGALYHYGRTVSSAVKQQATYFIIQAVVFGLLVPNIDNYAHLGGFIGGYAASAALNPMTRERGDHVLAAIGCLVASLVAIVFSFIHGLQFVR